VGLFDFLKGRRERESATHGLSTGLDPSQQVRAEGSGGPSAFDTTPPAQSGQAADVDWAQLAQIGPMIQRAIQSGNVQISHGEPQSIDASQMPAMQQQILDALSQAGVDLGGVSSSGEDSPG
jgi:ABC-type taurine transport system substrate-binding protein